MNSSLGYYIYHMTIFSSVSLHWIIFFVLHFKRLKYVIVKKFPQQTSKKRLRKGASLVFINMARRLLLITCGWSGHGC
jgi:hypothetical protein